MRYHLEKSLSDQTNLGIKTLFGVEIPEDKLGFQDTRKDFPGQLTLITFPFAGLLKKKPDEVAMQLGEYLKINHPYVSDFNVVKGFLNLELSDSFFVQSCFNPIHDKLENKESVLVEYSSPNTNKPLHLGHIRNIILGYSVSQIMEESGRKVVKANLINDRGIHICKSMVAYQKFGNGETPESTGIKGDKLVGNYYVAFDKHYKKEVAELLAAGVAEKEAVENASIMKAAREMLMKWEAGDDEVISLWKQMNEWVYAGFEQTYNSLGVSFDQYYYESNTYLLGKEHVLEGLKQGIFFKKEDGSVWVDLTNEGLDEKILLRSDGTSVYITQDIGTAFMKMEDHKIDKSIYVVGNEQDYHFKVLFQVLEKLNSKFKDACFHLSYGMVDLPSGKMKSREGTVVDADDLIAEMQEEAEKTTEALGKTGDMSPEEKKNLYHTLAMGALKFYLLKVDPKKRILFDPKESIDFQGHTGPFVQYAYARINALLVKAESEGFKAPFNVTEDYVFSNIEKDLIVMLINFRYVLQQAAKDMNPALIANYAFDLAKQFNRFYQDHPVVVKNEINQSNVRLQLSLLSSQTIKQSLQLLGISVPSRM